MTRQQTSKVDADLTCAPATASANAEMNPEFIRLPKSGTLCPYTGLTRSTLNTYILPSATNGYKPEVNSYAMRRRGKVKGIRLIDYEDLCDFIRKHGGHSL